jgi:hypothetical protein
MVNRSIAGVFYNGKIARIVLILNSIVTHWKQTCYIVNHSLLKPVVAEEYVGNIYDFTKNDTRANRRMFSDN